VERVGFRFVLGLIGEAFITGTHRVVGDEGVDAQRIELLQIVLAVVAGIGGDHGLRSQ
jgi:hypothetical protein